MREVFGIISAKGDAHQPPTDVARVMEFGRLPASRAAEVRWTAMLSASTS